MYRRKILLFISLIPLGISVSGQISYGGNAVMNAGDYDPSEVIYILEQEDAAVVEGLKNAKYNSYKKALHYAIEKQADLSPEFNGAWSSAGSMNIWRIHIISPGAYALGVLFSEYRLNKGVRVFLYDPEGDHLKGAFTCENNKEYGSLMISHIPGQEIIIEMQVDKDVTDFGELRVGAVSHAVVPLQNGLSTGLGGSQDCEIDINCEEGDEWQIIKKSVCRIYARGLYCTGTLINNTSYNGKAYVITAEHCINHSAQAANAVFVFDYENSTCYIDDGDASKSVSGATLLATGDSLDFTLLELSEKPPRDYNVYYAGWDLRKTNFSSSITIHHPNADAKKISYDFDPTETAEQVPGDLNDYIPESNFWIQQWDIGTTEGGSSGGPLFNSSKRLIGVLSGGLAYCGDSIGYDEVSDRIIYSLSENRNDFYSRLNFNWDYFDESDRQLKTWLDPGNTGQVSIGGLSPMTVGAETDFAEGMQIRLFPNPSSGIFRVILPDDSEWNSSVEIYDLQGRLLFREEADQLSFEISLDQVGTGVYMIRIRNGNNNFVKPFLIER